MAGRLVDRNDLPGPGVDAAGRPVIDPTENVKSLTEAAVRRLDDLANMRTHYSDRLEAQRAIFESRLREADRELRKAESDRIDAIRAVDVGAVQRAAEVSAAQAEALRNTVAAAAAAAATALGAALDPIQKDIADLRRAQYEAQGQKAQVVETRASAGSVYGLIGAVGGLILLAIAVVGFVITNSP